MCFLQSPPVPTSLLLRLCGLVSYLPPRLQSGRRLPPPGVGVRSWGMDWTNPWRMTQRASGAQTSSRAFRKRWPSTHLAAAERSSSLMRARCTVRLPQRIFDMHRSRYKTYIQCTVLLMICVLRPLLCDPPLPYGR